MVPSYQSDIWLYDRFLFSLTMHFFYRKTESAQSRRAVKIFKQKSKYQLPEVGFL